MKRRKRAVLVGELWWAGADERKTERDVGNVVFGWREDLLSLKK